MNQTKCANGHNCITEVQVRIMDKKGDKEYVFIPAINLVGFNVVNNFVESTQIGEAWQQNHYCSEKSCLSISLEGIGIKSKILRKLRWSAFFGSLNLYQIIFDMDDAIEGLFYIAEYSVHSKKGSLPIVHIKLKSSGEVNSLL